jgi:hypothetical protein
MMDKELKMRGFKGAHIGFAGALYTDRPNAEVLSVMVPLCVPETDMELRMLAARHFGALKKAVTSLKAYYIEEQYKGLRSLPNPRFPYKHSYRSYETSVECKLEYLSVMKGGNLMFTARTEDSTVVCVKFSRIYCVEAHRLCASMGFAPAVRGFERLPGGWFMIVMDYVSEEYHHMENRSTEMYEMIKEKITALHQRGYVHGDLRDRNLMVRRKGSLGLMLFDFEWSGLIGEVRYPMNVGRGPGLERPMEAVDGELIKAEHDIEMLEIMFKSVSNTPAK